MTAYPLKVKRLAIAFILTFLIADLWHHPRLSSGIIVSTLARVQETLNDVSN